MCDFAHLHGLAGKLGQQDIEALLDSNTMTREFIIRWESSWGRDHDGKSQKKRILVSPTHQDEQTLSFCLHLWLSEANVSTKRNAYICINAPSECTLCCLPHRECTSNAWRDEGLVDGWPSLTPLRISSPMTGRGKYICSGGPIAPCDLEFHHDRRIREEVVFKSWSTICPCITLVVVPKSYSTKWLG